MTNLYSNFLASITLADKNALIIFGTACLSVAAWHALELLPLRWRHPARWIAWMYAVLIIGLTIIIST